MSASADNQFSSSSDEGSSPSNYKLRTNDALPNWPAWHAEHQRRLPYVSAIQGMAEVEASGYMVWYRDHKYSEPTWLKKWMKSLASLSQVADQHIQWKVANVANDVSEARRIKDDGADKEKNLLAEMQESFLDFDHYLQMVDEVESELASWDDAAGNEDEGDEEEGPDKQSVWIWSKKGFAELKITAWTLRQVLEDELSFNTA